MKIKKYWKHFQERLVSIIKKPWGMYLFFFFLSALEKPLSSFSSLAPYRSAFGWILQQIELFLFPIDALKGWYQCIKRILNRFRKLLNHVFFTFLNTALPLSVFCLIRIFSKEKSLIKFYWLLLRREFLQ